MSLLQLLECNGCGARTAPSGPVMQMPPGWRVFDFRPLASQPQRKAEAIAACPECWESKTCAELLGGVWAFLAV